MQELPLSRPSISEKEKQYIAEVLDSGRLSMGPWLSRFEEEMKKITGARYAIAVSSGTAALHLIIRALGITKGHEVITTPYSFIASSNCLLYEAAIPFFADIDPKTFNLDPNRIEGLITPLTKAILAVDVFGHPANWEAIDSIAKSNGLMLISDACEALGASVNGRMVGTLADTSAFGFYPNKQITTGEGGCITTNDESVAVIARSLRNQGRSRDDRMEHLNLGYNYRLNELSAALGCAQIERSKEIFAKRENVARWYAQALGELQHDILLPVEKPWARRSWFVFVIRLADHFSDASRDLLLSRLAEKGIASAPYFPAIHLQPLYKKMFGFKPGDFPITEATAARTLALPFFPQMTEEQVNYVANTLKEALPRLPKIEGAVV